MEHSFTYSVPDASKLIGIGLTKTYAEINAGRLEAIKLGRRTLIRREAIENWLENLPAYTPLAQRGRT